MQIHTTKHVDDTKHDLVLLPCYVTKTSLCLKEISAQTALIEIADVKL